MCRSRYVGFGNTPVKPDSDRDEESDVLGKAWTSMQSVSAAFSIAHVLLVMSVFLISRVGVVCLLVLLTGLTKLATGWLK